MKPNQNYQEAASSKSKNNKVATQKQSKQLHCKNNKKKKKLQHLKTFPET
jgi:hypothetical protein